MFARIGRAIDSLLAFIYLLFVIVLVSIGASMLVAASLIWMLYWIVWKVSLSRLRQWHTRWR